MKPISLNLRKTILIFALILTSSCSPPNYSEDAMNRGMRMEGGEVYSDQPGQSQRIDLVYVADPRPDYVKQADNPNYDKTAGGFGRMWNAIFGGEAAPPSPREVANFQPEPINSEIDNYDFVSGRVRIDPTAGMENDPEAEEMRKRREAFEAEINRNNQLRAQRDYLEGKASSDVQRFMEKKVEGFNREVLAQIEALKTEIDTSIVEHNKSVDRMIYEEVQDVGNERPVGVEFRTAANTVNGQRVRAIQYSIDSAKQSVSQMTGEAKQRGETMLGVAQNAVILADKAYADGDQAGGDFATEIALTAVDVGLSLIPGVGLAKDVIEAASGYSIVTGKKLSSFERSIAVVGILTLGYGSVLKHAGKAIILADVLKVGKTAEEVAEIAQATSKATEIIDSARNISVHNPIKPGVLHNKPIKDIIPLDSRGVPIPNSTIADTFRSGSYLTIETKDPTTLYRAYSDSRRRLGPYWSRMQPTGPKQAVMDSALDPTWGNQASKWIEIKVPAGTVIHEGIAAPVSNIPAGVELMGGGNQVYLDIQIPIDWINPLGGGSFQ